MAEGDPRLAQIVGRHGHVHTVTDADADEILPHLAGDVRQHFVAVGQCHAKHRAGQHLCHRPGQLDWFFFGQASVMPD